ncbi:Sage1-Like Protein-Like [Manis pentadactyla]|nr:Sage1-Like Protein-Like [Manis pentadactyla]
MDTTPPSKAVIFRSHPTPHGAVGSTNFGVKAGNDAQDEPMDTAPPSMAVTFQSPTALHGAVGSTTFCLRNLQTPWDPPIEIPPHFTKKQTPNRLDRTTQDPIPTADMRKQSPGIVP